MCAKTDDQRGSSRLEDYIPAMSSRHIQVLVQSPTVLVRKHAMSFEHCVFMCGHCKHFSVMNSFTGTYGIL